MQGYKVIRRALTRALGQRNQDRVHIHLYVLCLMSNRDRRFSQIENQHIAAVAFGHSKTNLQKKIYRCWLKNLYFDADSKNIFILISFWGILSLIFGEAKISFLTWRFFKFSELNFRKTAKNIKKRFKKISLGISQCNCPLNLCEFDVNRLPLMYVLGIHETISQDHKQTGSRYIGPVE